MRSLSPPSGCWRRRRWPGPGWITSCWPWRPARTTSSWCRCCARRSPVTCWPSTRTKRRLRVPARAGAGGGLRRTAAGAARTPARRLRPGAGPPDRAPRRRRRYGRWCHRRRAGPARLSLACRRRPGTGAAGLRAGRAGRGTGGGASHGPRAIPTCAGAVGSGARGGCRAARWTRSRCCTVPPRQPTWPAAASWRWPWPPGPWARSTRPPSRCGLACCWNASATTTGSPRTDPRRWTPSRRRWPRSPPTHRRGNGRVCWRLMAASSCW